MKKLFNSRFLFIMAISIVVLIVLTIGAFYLFDDSEDSFIKSGYVLNPLSEKVERYFFDKDTTYRTNLSSMVEFNDIDQNEVSVLKDSFVHYTDYSLSFLKNGAILDLDSIKGNNAVTFYNITNKSIIEKDNNGYYIENSKDTIKLNNFIGRISDNKYIIVGKVQAKIPGNESLIDGDYFEIVYVEEGIINIENKDVKYQVAADGTIIYINNLAIDLGNKKISLDGEDIMSITAITIDGNENVEIIPKAPEEDKDDGNGTGSGTGGGGGTGTGNGNQIGPNGTGENQGDGTGGGTGDGSGNGSGGTGTTDKPNIELENGLIVTLKDANISSNSITVTFDVINETEDDLLMLKVTNMNTGRTVDLTAQVLTNEPIGVKLLSPNTKYLFTVINELDGNKYFQKVLETNDFGVSLEKNYATDSSLSYNVNIDSDTDITRVKLSLYKFNEDTGENELIENGEKWIDKGEETVYEREFDDLDSNSIYTAVLSNFETKSATFLDIYEITLSSLTLKKTPDFYNMVANKVIEDASYKLSYENISDEDNAIISYTYYIYEYKEDLGDEKPKSIKKIEKDNASPAIVYFGDEEGQLSMETPYYYQTVIKYFDNEKYVEYMPIKDKINFVMGGDPIVTVIQNEEKTSYDSITASITITDPGCSIHMPNRENCPADDSSVFVKIIPQFPIESDNPDDYTITMYIEKEDYEIKNGEIIIDELVISNPIIEEGSLYGVEVHAIRSDLGKLTLIDHSEKSQRILKTKTLSSFTAIFPDEDEQNSSANHVVNQRVKLEVSEDNKGTLSPEDSANAIKKVIISLYEGEHTDVTNINPIVSPRILIDGVDGDLKELFYDNYYTITTDETFELDIEKLKELTKSTEGKNLAEYYTIKIEAYYDIDAVKDVKINNNIKPYQILESLTWEALEEPQIIYETFNRDYRSAGKNFDKLVDGGTIVGYKVNPIYDRAGMIAKKSTPKEITIYVYDANKKPVKFYIEDENGGLKLVDKLTDSVENLEIGNYLNYIYMDYGLSYGDSDDIMRRGNSYYIGYVLSLETEKGIERYPSNAGDGSFGDYGLYTELLAPTVKETPKIKTYISSSDKSSITYWYQITDPDNVVYKEDNDQNSIFYYTINGEDKGLVATTTKEDNSYITISGLKNNDLYSFYYKSNPSNTGVLEEDIKPTYLDDSLEKGRLFDGYYDALEKDGTGKSTYNFKYEIVNNLNPDKDDNKVTIKVLASDDLLKRIIHYHVVFNDSKGNSLEKQISDIDLTLCDDDSEEDLPRCFSVDYTELKNKGMKSDKDKTNPITVSINAYYDNGITGYDAVLSNYKYMIFQNNNTTESGEYVTFNSDGKIGIWKKEMAKGYYTYSTNKERSIINYKRYLNTKNDDIITHDDNITNVGLSSVGYNSQYGILNPKMISMSLMNSDNNTFSFTSITPTVKVSTKTGLINGTVQNLTLYGVDLADVKNEGSDKSPEYYLYINVWNNLDDALADNNNVVRPLVKVPINKDNPNSTIEAVIDGLAPLTNNEHYFFNVYAYMYKDNGYKLIQLFNESSNVDNETKSYYFDTKTGESLFNGRTISYNVTDEEYGKRYLHTEINLSSYNGYPYNFDLMYMICEDDTCTKDEGYIFKKRIPKADVLDMINNQKKIVSEEEITKYDLEYGKSYNIYIYGITSLYEKTETSFTNKEQHINMITTNFIPFDLPALREPSFVITRKAQNDDNGYFIDFNITVNDLDQTIIDGIYHVKLTDMAGNVVGDLYEEVDGELVPIADYSNHDFDAAEKNSHMVIRGLSADTKYSILVYGKGYVNNYNEEIPKENRTYEVNKSHIIYTTDIYGITFGKDISYQVDEDSYIVSFRSATNFDNVKQVNYTVHLDTGEIDEENKPKYQLVATGNDVIDNTTHKFEFNHEVGYGYYVMKRTDGLKNQVGDYYLITLNFDVVDPNDNEKTINLSSAYNSKFTITQPYLKVDD